MSIKSSSIPKVKRGKFFLDKTKKKKKKFQLSQEKMDTFECINIIKFCKPKNLKPWQSQKKNDNPGKKYL